MLKKILFTSVGIFVTIAPFSASAQTSNSVSIIDDSFSPGTITVPVDSTVVWNNNGSMQHTVTADDGSFNSGSLNPGASFSHAFTTPGTYPYHCQFHGAAGGVGMSGTVVVVASGSGTNSSNTSNTSSGTNSTLSALQAEMATLTQEINQLTGGQGSTSGSSGNTSTVTSPNDNETGGGGTTQNSCPDLTSTLSQGQSDSQTNGQITMLQTFLAAYFGLSPSSIVTGYFGPTTASYVAQFQAEQSLPQVGYVGQLTRAAIASVCNTAINPSGATTFSASPSAGQVPLATTFTASGSNVTATSMVDFGDSSTSTLTQSGSSWTASHTYSTPGTYTARVESPTSNGIEILGTQTITASPTTNSNVVMTVPGAVSLAPGQTAVWSHPGYVNDGQPFFTFNGTSTAGSAIVANITVVTGICESVSSSGTNPCPNTTQNVALALNAPQIIGDEEFTLTALGPTSATIAVAPSQGLTFSVPGTISFVAARQNASDMPDGYVLTLNSMDTNALTAAVTWQTQSPCGSKTPPPAGSPLIDCDIAIFSHQDYTLALGTPQMVGNINLLLTGVSAGGAQISVTGGNVNPDYSVTASPASGAAPLAVSLSYSSALQQFVNSYCEEAQGTAAYNVVVDWGDGAGPSNDPNSVCNPHTYNTGNTYTIHVSVYQGAGTSNQIWTGTAQVSVTGGVLVGCPNINQSFGPGATDATTGGEVSALQKFLAGDPTVYPEGLVTGFYGPATTRAVQRFQTKNDIVDSGTPDTTGFGYVGPKTIAALMAGCPTYQEQLAAAPSSGASPLPVTFTATAVPGTYSLDFGDSSTPGSVVVPVVECPSGSCTNTATLSHTYTTGGAFTATLSRGSSATSTVITVSGGGGNGVLSAAPSSGTAPLSVNFSATVPQIPLGDGYWLDPGDSSTGEDIVDPCPLSMNITPTTGPCNPVSGVIFQRNYLTAGTYTAKLFGPISLSALPSCALSGSSPNCSSAVVSQLESTLPLAGSATVTVTSGSLGSCTTALPTHDLSLGTSDSSVGGDVTLLQEFLKAQGTTIYPEGLVTGFFGNATQAAVERFQQARGVSPASGIVGSLTRAAMQSICGTPGPGGGAFTASLSSGAAPLPVTFTATDLQAGTSDFVYVIDFGDGSARAPMNASVTTNALVASHTYTQDGTFTAKVYQETNLCSGYTISGCVGDVQVESTTITVTGGSSQSLAVSCAASPASAAPGSALTWTATATGGAGGYTYAWSDSLGNKGSASTGASWQETYQSAGSPTATVAVTDANGATANGTCSATVANSQQNFSVGTDCNGSFCSADQTTANQLCVAKGFASASTFQSYPMTQSNPNVAGTTGNEDWWNGIAWQSWWAGQCNTGGTCTPGNGVSKEISQVSCTGTAPASLVGTANLPAATNLSASCTGDTAMFAWTPQGTVPEWQLTLSAGAGGAWECQPGSNQMCSTMVYNSLNPTFSTNITVGVPFTWSVAPEQSNGATGPSTAGPQVSCASIDYSGYNPSGGG